MSEWMHARMYSAVLGDLMDKRGLLHQFLPPAIQPLRHDFVVAGRAMPVLEADTFTEASPDGSPELMRKPFGLMFAALDDLHLHEVYVAAGASSRYALWGELMSTRSTRRCWRGIGWVLA